MRATSSMWANPDLPFDPKTALPIRHPLVVAVCRCWRRLRFSHVLTARQASTSKRAAVGGASNTEMGQLFQPLAVLSHHLHCYNNGLRTRTPPAHNDGRVTPHYTISLTATAEDHPYTVMSAPLRHPAVSWYGAHRHPLRMWAAPPPQSSYGALPPRGRQCAYGPTAHPSFNTQQANIILHPTEPVTGGVQRRHLCNASL